MHAEEYLALSATLRERYARAGFCCTPTLFGSDEIHWVNAAVDAVVRGEYETGVAPFTIHRPEHLTQPLVKIDAAVKQAFAPPAPDAWRETPMLLPPGAVSFHHRRTIHGSYPNASTVERRSFAVHMCTENARVRPNAEPTPYIAHLDDPCGRTGNQS